MRTELFIGITTWNSARFLGPCLRAIEKTTRQLRPRVVVLDNVSSDGSAQLARSLGAEVHVHRSSQADALNRLIALSRSRFTLLMHADVILLSDSWFELCRSRITDACVLVSPEDIGCGPFTRPFGRDKPESSFLFFKTEALRRLATRRVVRWHGLPRYWVRQVDFYGPHVTHRIPERLAAEGMTWCRMHVHVSDLVDPPPYGPYRGNVIWNDELARLRYGLANFYSLEGVITHYHNWYERALAEDDSGDANASVEGEARGFPRGYIREYTAAFLADYEAERLVLPDAVPTSRIPQAL